MSTQKVKTREWDLLRVERNIRPYRHAIIRINNTLSPNTTTLTTIVNEFCKDCITVDPANSPSNNILKIPLGLFKNIKNVELSLAISYDNINTNIIPGAYAAFESNVYDKIYCYTVDLVFFSPVAVSSTVLTIKEYYG